MDYGKEVGRIINERRRERGMTQEQLAEKLGVTYQAVSKWENGLACPDIALLPVIAGVFDTTVDALFGLEAKKAGGTQEGLPWEDAGFGSHGGEQRGPGDPFRLRRPRA